MLVMVYVNDRLMTNGLLKLIAHIVTELHKGHTNWSEPPDLGIVLSSNCIITLIIISIRQFTYHGYNISIINKTLVSIFNIGIRYARLVAKISLTQYKVSYNVALVYIVKLTY